MVVRRVRGQPRDGEVFVERAAERRQVTSPDQPRRLPAVQHRHDRSPHRAPVAARPLHVRSKDHSHPAAVHFLGRRQTLVITARNQSIA